MKRHKSRRTSLLLPRHGVTVRHEDFVSARLGNSRALTVHLPPGYELDPSRRYPVLFMQDGQNLFEDNRAAFGVSWHAAQTADHLCSAGRIRPFLLVGIDNTPARLDEYAIYHDPRHEAGGRGEEYATFVVDEVKPFVDREYRTLTSPSHVAIAGSSMGGLVALTTAWRFPGVFGLCGVVSPSLWWCGSRILDDLEADTAWMKRMRFWLCKIGRAHV